MTQQHTTPRGKASKGNTPARKTPTARPVGGRTAKGKGQGKRPVNSAYGNRMFTPLFEDLPEGMKLIDRAVYGQIHKRTSHFAEKKSTASAATIAKALGVGEKAVDRSLKRMEGWKVIRCVFRGRDTKQPSHYETTEPSTWKTPTRVEMTLAKEEEKLPTKKTKKKATARVKKSSTRVILSKTRVILSSTRVKMTHKENIGENIRREEERANPGDFENISFSNSFPKELPDMTSPQATETPDGVSELIPDVQSQEEERILTLPDDPRWREREEPEEDDDEPMPTEQKTRETPDVVTPLPTPTEEQGELDMSKPRNQRRYEPTQDFRPVIEQFLHIQGFEQRHTAYQQAAREWEALHPKTPTPRRASAEQAAVQPAVS